MGVKLLNKFIHSKCEFGKKSIKKIGLHELKNKKVGIDTSIYLYKYKGDDKLLENFYNLCKIFRINNITPLFIFDGKPPKEKKEELVTRSKEKKKAESEYKMLEDKMKNEGLKSEEKDIILEKMIQLKKQFLRIKSNDIDHVKMLITSFGMSYVIAKGESDSLCGYLASHRIVDAIISDDMDMFVYGCPYILKNINLTRQTCIQYDYKHILETLNIDIDDFKKLCILSGTDYTKNKTPKTVFNYYKDYSDFKSSNYKCLFKYFNDKYRFEDIKELEYIYNLYNIDDDVTLKKISKNIVIKNGIILKDQLQNVMEMENFVFL